MIMPIDPNFSKELKDIDLNKAESQTASIEVEKFNIEKLMLALVTISNTNADRIARLEYFAIGVIVAIIMIALRINNVIL